jgi:hypothetical protein
MDHAAAIERLDSELRDSPDVTLRIAWRVVRQLASRVRRISSTTLPRAIDIAQHAIKARDALDTLVPVLPPSHYAQAMAVRDALVAIIDAQGTGATGREDETPTE